MLTPTVQSALVALIAYLLKLACDRFGIPLDEGVLTAIATAIVAYLLGVPAGERVARGFRRTFGAEKG